MNLAGEPNVGCKLRLNCKTVTFEIAHLAGITFKELNAAGRAARVAAATVKNIDAGIFNSEDKFLSGRYFSFNETTGSFSLNFWHLRFAPSNWFFSAWG